jgi:preprotein translocase subunit SecY
MNTIFTKLKIVLSDSGLRKRILFTIGALVVFRLLSAIPIPGIDALRLERLLDSNQLLGLLDVFSGGGIARLSIVMLGVGPYITGSIIMQLLTMMSPKIKAMYREEGEAGRLKMAQYSRMIAVPLAALQSFAFLSLLQNQNIIPHFGTLEFIVNIAVVSAGSLLLMWIGELISEFGIGNGVSLIIFAGIITALPNHIVQFVLSFNPAAIPQYIVFAVIALFVIIAVVAVTEAERPVPVTYSRQAHGTTTGAGGTNTYIPLRINQAGVMPIIFALSILLFPQIIANYLSHASNVLVADWATRISLLLTNQWFHGVVYFAFVFIFTYFYTAVTFEPKQVSENLQKSGAFIPGIRPGEHTTDYLANIVTRITFVGALFLGAIAVLPVIMQGVTGNQALNIGGTALLIVVSVVLDLIKRVDAQVSMREY